MLCGALVWVKPLDSPDCTPLEPKLEGFNKEIPCSEDDSNGLTALSGWIRIQGMLELPSNFSW